eukprot:GDKH01018645.1.p1 GENE.GDKH01018645.1~~GDKH01018645.1.p1  ORF type:complete len:58 (-),score=1.00 GDKH01018645.1:6-179(-)
MDFSPEFMGRAAWRRLTAARPQGLWDTSRASSESESFRYAANAFDAAKFSLLFRRHS